MENAIKCDNLMSNDNITVNNLSEYVSIVGDKQFPVGYFLDKWELLSYIFPEDYCTNSNRNESKRLLPTLAFPTTISKPTISWTSNSRRFPPLDNVYTTWSNFTPISSPYINQVTLYLTGNWLCPFDLMQTEPSVFNFPDMATINVKKSPSPYQHSQ